MRFPLHRRAVLLATAISVLTALLGCATSAPLHETDSGPAQTRTPASTGRVPEDTPGVSDEEGSAPRHLPDEASEFLEEGLTGDLAPVIVDDSVAAGWFYAPDDGNTAQNMSAMGLYESSQSLELAYRGAGEVGRERSATHLTPLLPRSETQRVRSFEQVHLRTNSVGPNGFRVRFSGDNRDEEILVIWTARPEQPPYTVRLPISAVRRTALRDLTGDDIREMVHLSVVFDTTGNREIIADAHQWNDARFVHVGSVSLLQAINGELTKLETRLSTDEDDNWKTSANSALQPIEDSPPVRPLLPAMRVRVPRITELSIDLGRGEWEFFHDIAVDGNLYRLRIHLEANPLAEHPAQIVGIQGM
jgi:hypothetical protein